MYTEEWVEKLYRGFKRNSTIPFEFICFTDRERDFKEPITQERLDTPIDYSALLQPLKLDRPTIICGLDTMIVGNVDHLMLYTLNNGLHAFPRDPFFPHTICNGVVLAPKHNLQLWQLWEKKQKHYHNYSRDMDFLRSLKARVVMDDLWPGDVVSYKGHVKDYGLDGVKIVYFHGEQKPHEINEPWIEENWV